MLLGHHTKHTHTKLCDKICHILQDMGKNEGTTQNIRIPNCVTKYVIFCKIWEKMSVPDIQNLGLDIYLVVILYIQSVLTYPDMLASFRNGYLVQRASVADIQEEDSKEQLRITVKSFIQ